jgi:hypothetical protein
MAKSERNLIKVVKQDGSMGFVFFSAWFGAVVYFVGQVDGFWNIILAFLKACVWPAFLLHRALELMNI